MYTSLDLKQIRNLSYPQYREIISGINSKFNWDLQLNTISISGEFDSKLIPLYSDETQEAERVFRMSDALALKEMANKG